MKATIDLTQLTLWYHFIVNNMEVNEFGDIEILKTTGDTGIIHLNARNSLFDKQFTLDIFPEE